MSAPRLVTPSIAADSRYVRRVHVRAPLADDVRRAAVLVEDALRTASFPGERGRMLFIRRLDLGRIDRHAGPRTVALQIECAIRALSSNAVRFDALSAGDANAVWVDDRVAALTQLAERHADGAFSSEWFWSRLVPGWHPDTDDGSWLPLLGAVQTLPESPMAAAAIVNQVVRSGRAEELLRVSAHRAREWLRHAGFDAGGSDDASTDRAIGVRPGRHIEHVARLLLRSCPIDDRLVWLVTMLAVHEQPSRAGNPRLARSIRQWLRATPSQSQPPTEDRPTRSVRSGLDRASSIERGHDQVDASTPIDPALTIRSDADTPPAAPFDIDHIDVATATRADHRDAAPTRPADAQMESADARMESADAHMEAGAFSDFAGLLFLVTVVERLGIGPWLEDHPALLECGFAARLLQAIGERTGLGPDDPLWLALDEISSHDPLPQVSAWPEPVRALLETPRPRAALDSPLDVWLLAIRRWCRRRARMGLASIVRRPGNVRVSQSRIDIGFDLSRLDLRIRRMALDVDPGWVPWLGRVIRFHYLDPDDER